MIRKASLLPLYAMQRKQQLCSVLCLTAAGDDVDKKKPDPKIYNVAAQKLGVPPADCVVVEDSTIGLQAALGAGMRCIITYTPSTKQQVGRRWQGPALYCWPLSGCLSDCLIL